MIDQALQVTREPQVAFVIWLGLAALTWWLVPRRFRVLVWSSIGGAFMVVLAWLSKALPEPALAIPEMVIFVMALILLVAPVVLTVDRMTRRLTSKDRGALVSYGLAVAAGIGASLTSVAALWWVDVFRPSAFQGSFELAILTGVLTACVALVRVDRTVEAAQSDLGT